MSKTAVFLLSVSTMMLLVLIGTVSAEEGITLTPPEIHVDVALEMETYNGGDSIYLIAIPRAAKDAYVIRCASIEATGELGNYIEYNLEIGSVSCMGGGFTLLEAGVFYKPFNFLKAGFMKGHVLRGFEMYNECIDVTTAEKPVFTKKFSPCHPTGAVIETEYDIDETMGIHAQFAYMNGVGGTFNDEHDITLGFQFHTPFQGLAIGGFYTDWQWNASNFSSYGETLNVYDGYRIGFGYNYDLVNIHLRGEYYLGKGFQDLFYTTEKGDKKHHGRGEGDGEHTEDVLREVPLEDTEMRAYFIEGGYRVNTGRAQFSYIQPYVQYQWWNQAANLDDDYVFSFLTFGLTFGIGSNESKLRVEYQTALAFPDDNKSGLIPYSEEQAADQLIVRLQTGI